MTTLLSAKSPDAPAPKRRRLRRIAGFTALGLALVLMILTVFLRLRYNGKALASTIETSLDGKIRGRVSIENIDWPLSGVTTLVTGGWLEVEITDLSVFDEEDELVIKVPKGTLEIDVHAAIGGNYLLRNLKIADGGYVRIRVLPEPYPAHEYDTTVVSLVSAFYPVRMPSFFTGYSATRRPTIDVQDFEVSGPGIELEYLDQGFIANVQHLRGGGFFYLNNSDPLAKKLYYSVAATDARKTMAESATIQSGDLQLKLHDLEILRLGQLPSRWPSELVPRDIQYKIKALGQDGMELNLSGALLDSWIDIFGGDVELSLHIDKAGGLAKTASNGIAYGEDLSVQFNMEGPLLAPRLSADLRDIELQIPMGENRPTLPLRIDHALPTWDLATDSGTMKDIVAVTSDGGEVHLQASFQLRPLVFDVDIQVPENRGIDLSPYFPETLAELDLSGGTIFSGSLSAKGNPKRQELTKLDLRLGNARISGTAFRNDDRIEATGIDINIRKTRIADLHGSVDPETRAMTFDFDVLSDDTAYWLRKFGIRPMLKSVRGAVRVRGTITDPVVTSSLVARGVSVVDRVDVSLEYRNEKITVREAQASAMGGWLRGSGQILLGKVPRFRDLEAQVVNLNLSKIPVIGALLSGELDLKAEGRGTLSRPQYQVTGKLSDWAVSDEVYADTTIKVEGRENGDQVLNTTIGRELGGTLQIVDATLSRARNLAGEIKLDKVPIDSIFRIFNIGTDAGGELSTDIDLSGSVDSPTAGGTLTVLRSWFQGAFLGSAGFAISTESDSRVRIRGSLFQNRIAIDCTLQTKAPYAIEVEMDLHRIEIDRFAAELSDSFGVRGWVSGHVSYAGSLLTPKAARMVATLSETEIVYEHSDEGGRPSPIRLHNKGPIKLGFDGKTLKLVDVVTMTGPTGDLVLTGSGTADNLGYQISGSIAVEVLKPYLDRGFEKMSGALLANAEIGGSLDNIQVTGTIQIQNVVLKPEGQDAIINIPTGLIEVQNSQLAITELRVMVNDQFSNDVSELRVGGGIRLDNFRPVDWAVVVEGKLAAKLLLLVLPETISAASGAATVSMSLFGSGPDIDGSIEFDRRSPFSLTPRSLRRELSFHKGIVLFTDQDIELQGLAATVDGEGRITDISGDISMLDWSPVDVDIDIWAQHLPYQVPGTLELDVNLNGFRILGGVDGLEISGNVEIADGRYIRRMDIFQDTFKQTPATANTASVFEEIPLLGQADVDINILARAIYFDNNLGQVEFNGEVNIKGTPLRPIFDGDIQVVQGTFKFPLTRATFGRTSGSIRFSPGLNFPDQTPSMDIVSESDYRSSDGQQHLVTLRLIGPISDLKWDLSTSTGLNQIETVQLISFGRTPDEVRKKVLADDAVSGRPGQLDNQNVDSGNSLQLADEAIKEYSSTIFSSIAGDRLREVTGLDVIKLQLGSGSLGFYVEKKFTRSILGTGKVERAIDRWQWDVTGRYRFDDSGSFELGGFTRYFDDEADEDLSQGRVSLTYRGFWIP